MSRATKAVGVKVKSRGHVGKITHMTGTKRHDMAMVDWEYYAFPTWCKVEDLEIVIEKPLAERIAEVKARMLVNGY